MTGLVRLIMMTRQQSDSNKRIKNTVQRMVMFTKTVKFLPSSYVSVSFWISSRAGSCAEALAGDAYLWEAYERLWSLFPAPACFLPAATHKAEQGRISLGAVA